MPWRWIRPSANLAGFGGETASPRAVAAPFLRPCSRGGQDTRLSKAASSVRSLTNPLFENRSGVVLIEFDHLHELALGTIVASGEQRLHEFISIGVGLNEDAFPGLTVAVRRSQCGRLASGRAARIRQCGRAWGGERHPETRPNSEPEQHRRDRHNSAGVEDRSCLAGDDLNQRRTRRWLEVAARIDEVDNRDLDG